MTEKDLFDLKEKVDKAKEQVSEYTGQRTVLLKQLKSDWKCNSIEEAEDKLQEMKEEILGLDKSIETGITELEEKYDVQRN